MAKLRQIDCRRCRHGQADKAARDLHECYNPNMPQINKKTGTNAYGWPWGFDPSHVRSCTGYEEVENV